jgi:hypothetical protein
VWLRQPVCPQAGYVFSWHIASFRCCAAIWSHLEQSGHQSRNRIYEYTLLATEPSRIGFFSSLAFGREDFPHAERGVNPARLIVSFGGSLLIPEPRPLGRIVSGNAIHCIWSSMFENAALSLSAFLISSPLT